MDGGGAGGSRIQYRSLGFTLGAGPALSSAPAAPSSVLQTILSAVPIAKQLLPTIVADFSKPKSGTDVVRSLNARPQRYGCRHGGAL